MSAEAIEAGKAFVELLVHDAAFRKGIDGALKKLDSFGKSIQSIGAKMGVAGAAISAPFLGALHTFASLGNELLNMSKRTGQSVESLSKLKFVAEQSGSSLQDVVGATAKLEKALYGASTGNKKASAAFDALGLSVDSLMKMSPDEAFGKVAEAINKIPNPTTKAAMAMAIFGKSGATMLPMIQNWEELGELAPKVTLEQAEAAHKLEVAFAAMKAGITEIVIAIGTQLAPAATDLIKSISETTHAMAKWAGTHAELISGIGLLGAALTILAPILFSIGSAARAAAVGFNLLKKSVAFLIANPYIAALVAIGVGLYALADALGEMGGKAREANDGLADLINGKLQKIKELTDEVKNLGPAVAGSMDDVANNLSKWNLERAKEDMQQLLLTMMKAGSIQFGFGPAGFSGGGAPAGVKSVETPFDADTFNKGAGGIGNFGMGQFGPGNIAGMAAFGIRAALQRAGDDAARQHHGLPGFDSPPQMKGIQQMIGAIGTFSGQMATQIFGASGNSLLAVTNKSYKKHAEIERHLNNIEQKMPGSVGPRFMNGLA